MPSNHPDERRSTKIRPVSFWIAIFVIGAWLTYLAILIFCADFDSKASNGDAPRSFFGKKHPEILVVYDHMDEQMVAEVAARIAEGRNRITQVQLLSSGGHPSSIESLAHALNDLGRPVHIDFFCGSACVGLLLKIRPIAVIGDDAYLWFHTGGVDIFGHQSGCKFCEAVKPLYEWSGRLKSKPDQMIPWAEELSPGLSKFLISCGAFDDPLKGLALTWKQIKSFADTDHPLACTDIAGHDFAWASNRVSDLVTHLPYVKGE